MATFTATAAADHFDGGAGEDTVTYMNSPTGLSIYLVNDMAAQAAATGYAAGDTYHSIEDIIGSNFNDLIFGDNGDNKLYGMAGDDSMFGWGGTNYMFGGDGNDNLVGGPGTEIMDGGPGEDMISYQLSSAGVTVSMLDPSINTGDAKGDTYVNMENLTGSEHDDVLYGNNQAGCQLIGLGGNDELHAGNAFTTFIGGSGADKMFGSAAGGLIDYETAASGLTASFADPSVNTGDAAGDQYFGPIHDLAGSAFSDVLTGDSNNNNMLGLSGNDVMQAGAGNDTLTGGPGADTLTGGSSADMFVWGGSSIGPGDVHTDPMQDIFDAQAGIFDRITDFNQGNSGHYDATESDQLGLFPLLSGLYNHGAGQPVDSIVRLVEDASNTFALLQVDMDGSGSGGWLTLARLDGLHNGDKALAILDQGSAPVTITVGGTTAPPPPPPGPAVHLDEWVLSNGNWAASLDPGTHPIGFQVSGIGDFNHDGTSDLLWFNPTNNAVDLWMLSNGKWSASSDVGQHPAGETVAGIGDFNGDGSSDVLWVNPNTNETDIWMLANGKWAGSTTIGTHPAGYQVAGIGDVNRDGTSDVVWFNPTSGDVDIWKVQNGHWAGSVQPGQHPAGGWQVAGTGDFNHDGSTDIFFYNPGTGETDIWMLNNGQWAGSVSPGSHPVGYQVAGIGDFNHDGYSDVLWYNPSTQDTDEWKLVNGKWAGSVDIGHHGGSIAGVGDFNGDHTHDVLWNV